MELYGDLYNRMIDSAHIDRHKHSIYIPFHILLEISLELYNISLCVRAEVENSQQCLVKKSWGDFSTMCQSIIKQQELSGTGEGTDRQMEPTRCL